MRHQPHSFPAILFLSFGLFLSGCHAADDKKENFANYINTQIENSSEILRDNSITEYMKLEQKCHDPLSAERAITWQPKALRVKEVSDGFLNYLEKVKLMIQVNDISYPQEDFHLHIRQYEKDMTSIDSGINKIFRNKLLLLDGSDSRLFNGKSKKDIFTFLCSLENRVAANEFRLALYINTKSTVTFCGYYQSSLIVMLNSKHFKTGDEIEISAGIGEFSIAYKPDFKINNKTISLNENGIAIYKIRAAGSPGKHSIPLKVQYTDESGVQQKRSMLVDYDIDP